LEGPDHPVYNLVEKAVPATTILLNEKEIPKEQFLTAQEGTVAMDPRMPRLGGDLGAQPRGHVQGEERMPIFCANGPLPSLRAASWKKGSQTCWILDDKIGTVRCVTPWECWRAHGGRDPQWKRALNEGMQADLLATWALRAVPPKMGEGLLNEAIARHTWTTKAGICPLFYENRAWNRMTTWLGAGSGSKHQPTIDEEIDEWCNDLGTRAGAMDDDLAGMCDLHGGPDEQWYVRALLNGLKDMSAPRTAGKPVHPATTPANLLGPEAVKMRLEGRTPKVTDHDTREKWEQLKLQLILDKLAEGTKKSYSVGWRWWALFCRARGIEPFRWVDAVTKKDEEERLLDFVLHLAEHGTKAVGTIKQYLSAIRAQHVCAGYPDPTGPMTRLWMAIEGLRRRQGAPRRKRPVTPRMLRWIRKGLKPKTCQDDAMIWAAITTAFFFLLRSCEYTTLDKQGTCHKGKGLRGTDLEARRDGEPLSSWCMVNEVRICIRGSKTDQLNRGEYRNHFKVEGPGGSEVCVVSALETYAKHAPHKFTSAANQEPLFQWSNGDYLVRSDVHRKIAAAAVAENLAPEDLGTHSLRIGGASALWAQYKDSALVQRMGRWRSQAFHGYLWEARNANEKVAQEMARADLTMV
jgi:hypothetical protein